MWKEFFLNKEFIYTTNEAAVAQQLLWNHLLKGRWRQHVTHGDPRTDQKSAGGRPLPKSKRQELGIFHCEELSVELLLCDKNTIVLSVLKSNDVILSVAHVLTGSIKCQYHCGVL